MEVGILLFESLREALSLDPTFLNDIECAKGLRILGHYYLPCPQLELTLGRAKHAGNDLLCFSKTILAVSNS
ncbi:Isopenicillin N synthase-like [Parasponia andersonii]|uniref:Isopenicillin N synthase-like n=1 Tax=Parasponia andersonii TaxID=3476 RepID=A0A2P5A9X3_PARAD|nr:Isopenicillin N synthase-like [Parasponia andersonii]